MQATAALEVDPAAWKKRPGDVQRAIEEIAAMMAVPTPRVRGGSVEFPVAPGKCDSIFRRWRQSRADLAGLLQPPH